VGEEKKAEKEATNGVRRKNPGGQQGSPWVRKRVNLDPKGDFEKGNRLKKTKGLGARSRQKQKIKGKWGGPAGRRSARTAKAKSTVIKGVNTNKRNHPRQKREKKWTN